ncbi:MAG TPA: nucleotidyltransferase family protein [Polyangiaceae bacterium]|jgi:CTP:molybdopterin cytidylyltransferase MocA|nr:nucleotidyltransferase family protein [Polyangiaceae bacterium]
MIIAALVLAAGSSNRLGTPKQLVPIDGQPLVRHVVRAANESCCDAVAVILGAHAQRIEGALGGLDIVMLPNARWIEGMASSIRVGVAWADAQDFDAVMIVVADQLRITRDHIDALVQEHRKNGAMAASKYCDVLGVPAVFPRSTYPSLMALAGDRGARDVLRASNDVAEVDWSDGAFDVDVPADLSRLTPRRVGSPPERHVHRRTPRARARSR